jgi:hypothetical protein
LLAEFAGAGDVVVAKVDETPLLALKGAVDPEAMPTPITVRGEVEGQRENRRRSLSRNSSALSSIPFI